MGTLILIIGFKLVTSVFWIVVLLASAQEARYPRALRGLREAQLIALFSIIQLVLLWFIL